MSWVLTLVIGSISAATTAWILVAGVRRLALRFDLLDVPNERSLHRAPTPTLGGLGIAAAVGVGFAATALTSSAPTDDVAAVGLFAAGVGLLGLADDLYDLSWWIRLPVQVALSVAFCAGLGPRLALGLPGLADGDVGGLGYVVSVVWAVAVINFYNFMDGMDGLAAGMALIGGTAVAAASIVAGAFGLGLLAVLVASAALGFLAHNAPPARIFMGNVGSGLLGAFFASAALVGAGRHDLPLDFFVLVLAPFLFDAGLTLARRLWRGEPWYAAHRSHLYQRLVVAGWSQRRVDLVEGLWMTASALLGLAYLRCGDAARLALLLVALVGVGIFSRTVIRVEGRRRGAILDDGTDS